MNYTQEHLDFLEATYKTATMADVAVLFNKKFKTNQTESALRGTIKRNNIITNKTGYFQKGHIPFNKGKHGLNGVSSTSFKKGNIPHNTRKMFHERVDTDGFTWIKTKDDNTSNFTHKHRHVWEQYYGEKIPDGHCCFFKDGNKKNFDIKNLEIITRHELLLLNQDAYGKSDDKLKPSIFLKSKLKAKVIEIKKG